MPNLVWYSPLVPLKSRKVGYTANANYGGDDFASSWQRSGENSAFYGTLNSNLKQQDQSLCNGEWQFVIRRFGFRRYLVIDAVTGNRYYPAPRAQSLKIA
jgi:hypothetical protein